MCNSFHEFVKKTAVPAQKAGNSYIEQSALDIGDFLKSFIA
jgi:hypothetical protein